MKTKFLHSILTCSMLIAASYCSAQTPTFVKPANFDDVPVYRVQIMIITADVSDAGTDDGVYIKLRSNSEPFYLDATDDDRERKTSHTYDIIDPSVNFIRDIGDMTIAKQGTDGWAITHVYLMVNGIVIFERTLPNTWIDGDNGHNPEITFTSASMRGAGKWNYLNDRTGIFTPPRTITKAMIISMVEAAGGNAFHYTTSMGVSWGNYTGMNTRFGDVIEATYRNSQTLKVDLDAQISETGRNAELDINFDLVISCNAGRVSVTMASYSSIRIWGGRGETKNDSNLKAYLQKVTNYLQRQFNKPNCTAHFDTNGNLVYY